jgi:hypothetical protein
MFVPFLLTLAQMRRIRPHFPLSHGILRVNGRQVLSGLILVVKAGPGCGAGAIPARRSWAFRRVLNTHPFSSSSRITIRAIEQALGAVAT